MDGEFHVKYQILYLGAALFKKKFKVKETVKLDSWFQYKRVYAYLSKAFFNAAKFFFWV